MLFRSNVNENLLAAAKRFKPLDDEALLIFVGDEETELDINKLIEELNQQGYNFFGGIFPAIVYGSEMSKQGAVIHKLPVVKKPFLIKGLENETIDLSAIEVFRQGADRDLTAVVLVDGLTANINGFLAGLFNMLADSVNYIGGGAGSLSFTQKPCLFSNEGLFQDAALVTMLRAKSKLGVRHGWEKLAGPVVATKTDRNTIYELNWRSAFQIYKKIVEADCGTEINEENFFNIAKGYPFGMIKDHAESIVRDPISVGPNGELICVGSVPENSVVDILKGVPSSLIAAAGQAAADCSDINCQQLHSQMIFDCISRVLFLGEHFKEELAIVNTKMKVDGFNGTPLGALTLGEISSYGDGYLEFFNKTIVTGAICSE